MTTERELREEEEKMEKFLEEERNPYSWKQGKWILLSLIVVIALGYFLG